MNGNGSPISIFLELLSESTNLNPNTNGLIYTMDNVILVKETETERTDYFLIQEAERLIRESDKLLARIEAITEWSEEWSCYC